MLWSRYQASQTTHLNQRLISFGCYNEMLISSGHGSLSLRRPCCIAASFCSIRNLVCAGDGQFLTFRPNLHFISINSGKPVIKGQCQTNHPRSQSLRVMSPAQVSPPLNLSCPTRKTMRSLKFLRLIKTPRTHMWPETHAFSVSLDHILSTLNLH